MLFTSISCVIFGMSLFGITFNFRNILIVLVGVETLLLSANLNFTFFSIYLDDLYGQLFSLFILTVAASESAIGLAIILLSYRLRGGILISPSAVLKF